jgi:predicted ATPase/DNA-binding CsgD family transcriptional regulator
MRLAAPQTSPAASGPLSRARRSRALAWPVASGGAPNNLPAALTSFVGRGAEVPALVRLLEGPPAARLLTLTGSGGVGKTRLALEVAARLLGPAFPDGAWLVELAPLGDGRRLPQVVAAVLGLHEGPDRSFADVLVDALRPRGLLLVLDNCEHLVEPCAELADTLLRLCPRVAILATSREPLGVAGETVRRVPSLASPDPRALPPLARLRECESVRLFVERAVAADGQFQLTERNAAAVAQICERLDGIPLALELAAARVPALSVEQIAARLGEALGPAAGFRLLADGRRTAPPRQRTLEAAVAWSYDLLRADERRLFERLAVFAGGWTLEAAEAVCGAAEDEGQPAASGEPPAPVLELLVRLVEKSLVLAEDGPDGAKRYRLPEPIRQFAAGRLRASGQESAIRGRHCRWCVRLAEEGEQHMRWLSLPWAARVRFVLSLDREFPNLRTAWQWVLDGGGRVEDGLRLVAALFPFFYSVGYLSEGRECLAALLAADRAAEPSRARALALSAAAKLAANHGDDAAALPLAEEYLALPAALRAPTADALVHNALGLAALREGDFARARSEVGESLAETRAAGDLQTAPLYLTYLAAVAEAEGQPDEARAIYEQALSDGRAVDFPIAIGLALGGLARLAAAEGARDRARALYEEALGALRDLGAMPQIALMLVALGHLAIEDDDPVRARARFAEGLDLATASGQREALVAALEGVAVGLIAGGRAPRRPTEQALRLLGAAAGLRAGRRLPPPPPAVESALVRARRTIGVTPGDGLLAEGRHLALGEAAALARAALDEVAGEARDPATPALTRREWEVAALLARGLSNRQIGEALVVAERTVEMHVSNILAKLGLASRAQVALWAVGQGLPDRRADAPGRAGG